MNLLCMLDVDFKNLEPSDKFRTINVIADINDDLKKIIKNSSSPSSIPGGISLTEKKNKYPTNIGDISFFINKLRTNADEYTRFQYIELYINEVDLHKLEKIATVTNGKYLILIDLLIEELTEDDCYSIVSASISKEGQIHPIG